MQAKIRRLALSILAIGLLPSTLHGQLAVDVPLRSTGGALFAHTNAIDLRSTHTFEATSGKID